MRLNLSSKIPLFSPNAHWLETIEESGHKSYTLFATKDIKTGSPVTIPKPDLFVPAGDVLLARFDGSCKNRKGRNCCGAGIVLHHATNDELLQEVLTMAMPLPDAEDSLEGGAIAAARAYTEAAQLLQHKGYSHCWLFVQGDSKPVIHYWKAKARLSKPALFELF